MSEGDPMITFRVVTRTVTGLARPVLTIFADGSMRVLVPDGWELAHE